MTQYQSDLHSNARTARGTLQEVVAGEPGKHPSWRHDGQSQHREPQASALPLAPKEANATGLAAHATPPARRVGIMGSTATSMDIARSLLDADIPVTLFDLAQDGLDKATAAMRSTYHEAFAAGRLTAAQRDRRVALLAGTVNLHHLKDCDVIIDALCAGTGGEETVLRRLHEVVRPGAIVMTCASHGDIDRVASLTRNPDNVLGLQASAGADGSRAWQITPGKATSALALARAAGLLGNLGKPRHAFDVQPQPEGLQ
ncbi:hypothetical protein GJV26_03180 [Massilia dura]|uniref:3-hydroxyacyl-CoA dehydrogenase NAD binding domain-containing protein n=1 Tax=Pseudoduganella dura TaxID=321982 RepID=A0A6I3X5L6_9BURK|nr:3-hydroxyacyl-CoA dehydrogenase NAD-binding domain-containing protein [Pseudoduganella dura]MUI11497.1 hypothetical protein [Pseudoduganella dura]GGX97344.1 hypothetical protein GCM10007386_30310 [Pseudoduganella dura]